jgi:3-hydroxyisobutyrate dehydrogenase-like beta-hydroxyacid dehydrogenase
VNAPLPPPRVALVGFGEAGEAFVRAPGWRGETRAWDILPERRAAMAGYGVETGDSAPAALGDRAFILSLVTADAALDAAHDCAAHLPEGALWCDMNSVAPQTKREAAAAIEAAGGRYADVAIMAPVDKGLGVPLLVSGPHALAAQPLLEALGFVDVRVVGEEVGRASAIKLCRSVMVKGLEALTAEMVLAASKAGVLDEVLGSLDASERAMHWADRADYNLDRMLVHGERRAAEMYEATEMLHDLGISPMMTENTVGWQQALGELGLAGVPDGLAAKIAAIQGTPGYKGEL